MPGRVNNFRATVSDVLMSVSVQPVFHRRSHVTGQKSANYLFFSRETRIR